MHYLLIFEDVFILEIHTKVYMDKMKNKTEKLKQKYFVTSNTVLFPKKPAD